MLHQEIKNAATMSQVANEIASDLRSELEVYSSYEVLTDESEDQVNVKVRDKLEGSCWIITSSVIRSIMEVLSFYTIRYSTIDYHLDSELKLADNHQVRGVPVFVICVRKRNSE